MTALPVLRRWGIVVLVVLMLGAATQPVSTRAQAPLHYVNKSTSVSEISFRFIDSQTFSADRLEEQISTQAPSFWAGVRNRFAFLPGLKRRAFPFDPVTLQKDVVRLRQFYEQNGFPRPKIDYPASQLDTSANAIHVIFTVREGTPLTIREMMFQDATGTQPLHTQFDGGLREEWATRRQKLTAETGTRFTTFKKSQIADDIQSWLRNRGFAFAQVSATAQIDTASTAVTLRYQVDPGPWGRISEIQIDGNRSVSEDIIRRELPFAVGDPFSAAEVSAGQQYLFDLNLFRVALADVPDQPRDSTVTVRYRVRETKLRAYSGQVGYGTQPGVTVEGSWRHRNFRGDARTLIVSGIADTGYPTNPPGFLPDFLARSATKEPSRRFRASVTLRQPYVLTDRLSASLAPFVQERINPNIGTDSTRFLGLNERQFGLQTSLTYDFLPFRSLSLQHSFARIEQFRTPTQTDTVSVGDDLFDQSIFSLSGTFGKADDFINPSRGFILQPSVQVGGYPFESGVDFVRVSGGLSGYLPVSENLQLAGRVFGGLLHPFGQSRTNLSPDASNRDNRLFQDRFSEYLFYAGGGSDVRGWRSQLAGGKVLRDSDIARADFVYRPIGARLKLGVNLEAQLPFPGLGSSWRTAVFLDAAYLNTGSLSLVPPPSVSGTIEGPGGEALRTTPSRLLVGTGTGVRYKTPFGFVRVDVAYKLTPDAFDLRRPGRLGENATDSTVEDPIEATPTRTIRRFRLHFGIGRSF